MGRCECKELVNAGGRVLVWPCARQCTLKGRVGYDVVPSTGVRLDMITCMSMHVRWGARPSCTDSISIAESPVARGVVGRPAGPGGGRAGRWPLGRPREPRVLCVRDPCRLSGTPGGA